MHALRRAGRVRAGAAVAAPLALGLAISLLALGVGTARASGGEIDVYYTSSSAIQVKLVDGTVVSSGSTIPAGSYTVVVYDPNNDTNPELSFSGPGVSFSTNLNSTGMGIDQDASFGPFTLATSSTYSIEDTNIGSSSLVSFGTTATATASGGSGAPSGGTATVTQTSGASTSTTSMSSSSTTMTLGHLVGTVTSSGKLTLALGGKAVHTLKAGLYSVTVVDHSKSAELILGTGAKTKLTMGRSSGTKARSLTLTTGKWFFEPTLHGPKTTFTVSM